MNLRNRIGQRARATTKANVMEQGNPVPLVYGEIMTGGIVVSAALDTEQL